MKNKQFTSNTTVMASHFVVYPKDLFDTFPWLFLFGWWQRERKFGFFDALPHFELVDRKRVLFLCFKTRKNSFFTKVKLFFHNYNFAEALHFMAMTLLTLTLSLCRIIEASKKAVQKIY